MSQLGFTFKLPVALAGKKEQRRKRSTLKLQNCAGPWAVSSQRFWGSRERKSSDSTCPLRLAPRIVVLQAENARRNTQTAARRAGVGDTRGTHSRLAAAADHDEAERPQRRHIRAERRWTVWRPFLLETTDWLHVSAEGFEPPGFRSGVRIQWVPALLELRLEGWALEQGSLVPQVAAAHVAALSACAGQPRREPERVRAGCARAAGGH